MQIIGLIWELALLGIAVYLYLYAIGYFKGKTKEQQRKIDEFRANNGWLKYASFLLGAIMIINLYIRITGFSGN
jgi:multisubunit Na+/H+ antiporter MnhC subunit